MNNWYDCVKSITVKTEYRLDNNQSQTGPTFDNVTSVPGRAPCADSACGTGKATLPSGHLLLQHIVNAVQQREELVEVDSPCTGTKWQGDKVVMCTWVLHIIAAIQYSA